MMTLLEFALPSDSPPVKYESLLRFNSLLLMMTLLEFALPSFPAKPPVIIAFMSVIFIELSEILTQFESAVPFSPT